MTYESRQAWGGPASAPGHPTSGAKRLVVAHHSAIPDPPCGITVKAERADMKSMHDYHVAQDWGGIGYNWCIFQSGRIYEGRGWDRTGAHTIGQNSSSVGICFVMDGEAHEPTAAALEAFGIVVAEGISTGRIASTHEVAPHDQFKNKVCPGKKLKTSGILTGPISTDAAGAVNAMPTLRLGKGGKDATSAERTAVKELQRRLNMTTENQTGYFGPITLETVKRFQLSKGLTPDGIVGPKTWGALPA